MKRLALFTTVVLIMIVGALAIWQMHEAVLLLALALALTAAVRPYVDELIRRGFRRVLAVATIFSLFLLLFGTAAIVLGTAAAAEIVTAIELVPIWYDDMRLLLQSEDGWRGQLGELLPPTSVMAGSLAEAGLDSVGTILLGLLQSTAAWLVLIVSAIALAFYLLLDRDHLERLWLSLVPVRTRAHVREIWARVYYEVGCYVRGEAIIVTCTVFTLIAVYSILEIPGGILLAIIGGLAQVVPLVGLPLAVLPAAAVAFTQGQTTGILTTLLALTALGLIKAGIAPLAFRGRVKLNPLLVIFLIMVLAKVGGLPAILLAPPLAAAIHTSQRVFTGEQRVREARTRDTSIQALQERLAAIEARIGEREHHSPQLDNMLERARTLIASVATELPAAEPEQPPLNSHHHERAPA